MCLYRRTSGYRRVIVHPEPAAHAVSEHGHCVPLAQNNATLTDDLSCTCATIKPVESSTKQMSQ